MTTLVIQNLLQGYTLLYFYGLLRSYLSRIFPEFFLKPVYPTMVAKEFQIDGVKITGKYMCESKNLICLFMPPIKTLP